MKSFFIEFTVAVIAVTIICQVAVAAQVTRVNPGEGQVYVNSGKDAGFIAGAEVCIYSDSGKIACGKIFRTTENYAALKVDKHATRYIKYGMSAQLKKDKND